jgi:energy-coupling factor transporter ATP-binding protein EcfA2
LNLPVAFGLFAKYTERRLVCAESVQVESRVLQAVAYEHITRIRHLGQVTVVNVSSRIVLDEETCYCATWYTNSQARDTTRLLNLTENVKYVLQNANLYVVFDIVDDEAAGVEFFGSFRRLTDLISL